MLDDLNLICKWCGKQCKNGLSRAKHEYYCKENPDYTEHMNYLQTHVLRSDKAISKYQQTIKLKRELLEQKDQIVTIKCEKCGKEFTRKLRNIEYLHSKNKFPRFCSKRCANSHVHSTDERQKISNSVKIRSSLGLNKKLNTKLESDVFNRLVTNIKNITIFNLNTLNADITRAIVSYPIISNKTLIHTCKICKQAFFSLFPKNVCSKKCERKNRSINSSQLIQRIIRTKCFKGWMPRNIEAHSETFWKKVLEDNNIQYKFNFYISKKSLGLDKKYGYYLDFKLKENIDLEIDGKQHLLKDRQESDKARDEALRNAGWKVYRIKWNEVNTEEGQLLMKNKINEFLRWYNIQ